MTDRHVWLITGAGRGLGLDIARAALAAGHSVVATGRDPQKVEAAIGTHADLLCAQLDVTQPNDARAAIAATLERFGRLDVLVNNAGNFKAGFFEEITTDEMRDQLETLLFGPMNVALAALPQLRKQGSGLLITITSTAGFVTGAYCSAYAAAKFGVEGWIESLAPEISPFGIRSMVVEPGFFRTELLTSDSTSFATPSIDAYAQRNRDTVAQWQAMNGQQGGDPAKLAAALVHLAGLDEPPARFVAGADAMQAFDAKMVTVRAQMDVHRALSQSLGFVTR